MKKFNKTIILGIILLMAYSINAKISAETGTVSDIDGNTYKTVKIGDYWWMAENLRVKHFNNGDTITQITGNPGTTSAYINVPYWSYPNNDATNQNVYGLNYSWGAATDSRCGCPTGWSLPDTTIWYGMAKALQNGGTKLWNGSIDAGWSKIGTRLKSVNNWTYYASATTPIDSLEFNALPSGDLEPTGYLSFGNEAHFWTKNYTNVALTGNGRRYIALKYTSDDLFTAQTNNVYHKSIRCVKLDSPTTHNPSVNNNELQAIISQNGNQITISSEKGDIYNLYQLNGSKILSGTIQNGTTTFSTTNFAAGVYMVSIESKFEVKRTKIIIP